MASIVVSGDTSGAVTITAPAIAGTTTLTLPTTSGTIVTTAGATTVQFAAGSAAAPSITFTGDTNTGIFSPTADTIAFSEGGVESMRIDSAGNVGIGASSGLVTGLSIARGAGVTALIETAANGNTLGTTSVLYGQDALNNGYAWNRASGPMLFGTANSERMRIDSSGNVIVGGTSTSVKFDVQGTGVLASRILNTSTSASQYAIMQVKQGNSSTWQMFVGDNDNKLKFGQSGVGDHLIIDSSGNVGIGTSSPSGRFSVQWSANDAASGVYVRNTNSNSIAYGGIYFGNDTSSTDGFIGTLSSTNTAYGGARSFLLGSNPSTPVVFMTAGTEKMRITSGGEVLVGKTAYNLTVGFAANQNGGVLVVRSGSSNSDSSYDLYSTGAGAYRFYVGMAGTIFATSTTISAISDARLKENIQDIDVGLDKVLALKPRKFDWKEGKGKDKKGDRGWIAQEFEQVFPEMIDTWKDPAPEGEEPYKSVNADLIPVLVKAIQELNAKVEAQAAEIQALKGAR